MDHTVYILKFNILHLGTGRTVRTKTILTTMTIYKCYCLVRDSITVTSDLFCASDIQWYLQNHVF